MLETPAKIYGFDIHIPNTALRGAARIARRGQGNCESFKRKRGFQVRRAAGVRKRKRQVDQKSIVRAQNSKRRGPPKNVLIYEEI